jgi:hypothetical protein
MKKLIIISFISAMTSTLFGQTDTSKYYKFSDTTFWVGKTYIIDNVLFNVNGPGGGLLNNPESLDSVITFLIKNPKLIVEIGCHTDNRPIPMTNDSLSLWRAYSVTYWLVYKGINPDRLFAVGYASKRPRMLYENTTVTFDKKQFPRCLDKIEFLKNIVLDEKFINSLPDNCKKEAAHKLNRRTEMKIIRIE